MVKKNKGGKKGQAAMEFLMTYGWAILVVLAAIGALAYFGVLSPKNIMPDTCTVGAGFGCAEPKATATVISLKIRNNVGEDITKVNMNFTGDVYSLCTDIGVEPASNFNYIVANSATTRSGTTDGGWRNMSSSASTVFRNGKELATIGFNCTGLTGTVSFDFTVKYTKAGESTSHTVNGKANLKVEQ